MAPISSSSRTSSRLLAGRRALVVEGSRRLRAGLRETVLSLGPDHIVCCDNGTDAIEDLRAERFDLVVCGHVPGPGYDTVTLLERIRELRLLPLSGTLLAVTGSRDARDVISVAAQGPDLCLLRPMPPAELRARLVSTITGKQRLETVFQAFETGDVSAAIDRTLALGPGEGALKLTAMRMLCEQLVERDDKTRAEEVLELAQAFGDAPWMQLALARIRSQQGRSEEARELLERLVSERPEYIASYDVLAAMEAACGEFPLAVRHLQEANARAGFTIGRFRRTGELAVRSGELGLAESTLDRLLGRVASSELAQGGDYVAMVDVLAARGKLDRAGLVARQLQRAHSYCADSSVLMHVVAYRRCVDEGGDAAAKLEVLLEALGKAGPEVSVETRLQALEACLEQGMRKEALAIARAIAASGRADRFRLGRIRELLERAPG